ncbi:hypothetical protein CC1G_10160 [Coprinopsis cinerea okayama7|uniref:Cytochrome b5 heme-binding domain-containing protein n=1 Tax=Coprinopsis cinerea (strain Okayama-7 / 130 / ATCC MYA-4618 / FGSC 9003) TaxID=240176 RepID=A8PEF8_COPC7|nr:hypothetical protein CC1G_10160 [Coprinopsis cinerea okayama7\|eukprot:XP_001840786.1 hypothetical protein CC1G_10160 [Coprinopsis cinerea okayama7\
MTSSWFPFLSQFDLSPSSIATYSLAIGLPILYVLAKSFLAPSSPSHSQETEAQDTAKETLKKPLKPIMQPPSENLAPPKDDPYTPEELTKYDGKDGRPIYVAIKGTIFDVTRKADVYGPGKSYSIFAGKDGSKGLGMSSLKAEHAIADYSDLGETERKVLDDWYAFFSKRYNIIGRVVPSSSS